ncbi:MAG TPA: PspC domain-containing protein [Lacisediminihabitans sp.]|uniref:ATP-binding protein n=1 Tax=Lacisediminihabitans sp. TaxID=2787631 RepID=UPI002EDB8F07
MTTAAAPRITRPRRVVLGGVCAGLADHLRLRVSRVRLVMILLAFCGGAGILFYLWLWALTPLQPVDREDPDVVRRAAPVAVLLVVVAAIGLLVAAVGGPFLGSRINAVAVSTLACSVLAVLWSAFFDRRDPRRSARFGIVVRGVCAGILILMGLALLLSSSRVGAMTAVISVFTIAAGIAVLVVPVSVRAWSERMGERTARVREVQRAEIAAHLHDSVLQTLALIQTRAGASSEVARLARAQERELRDWLFAGTTPTGNDLASELRDAAAAIELEYPARLEVVVVGESARAANAAIVAAAREAMVNAARHAGGEVSVYLEVSDGAADVFVRDRGPGFDMADLPTDRLGVRESIVGRMSRAGGWATVAPGAGGIGTEIHLHLETEDGHA